jgi:hypothetical protein
VLGLPRSAPQRLSRVRAQQAVVELREALAVEQQAAEQQEAEQGVAVPNLQRRPAEAPRVLD